MNHLHKRKLIALLLASSLIVAGCS
ncbi:MAG: hypothetical protein K0Q59_1730, partial [Paenibacillus sp.]|nr:hypothetical protein [Paenibacillus sp.]